MTVARTLGKPFRATAAWFGRSSWPVKVGLVIAALVGLPMMFVVIVYLLPPHQAVALGKPVLAWLSDAPPLPADLEPVSERSVLLAADGAELATLYDEVNRVRVALDDVAPVVVDALLAAEDDAFYEHPGINHRAVMRATVANLRAGDVEQGGSTLTQQLVKNVYLDPARTLRRKLTEAWYSLELEDRLTKDEILERYLNEAYFGNGTYGIAAAAELYFSVTAAELEAQQAAMLVGILRAPSRLDPLEHPSEAVRVRDVVLERMAETGRLPASEISQLRDDDLGVDYSPPPPPDEPFFVAHVRRLLLQDSRFDEVFGEDEVRRERIIFGGGLTIHTTLDSDLQDQANAAIVDTMGDAEDSPMATLVTVQPGTGHVLAMAVGPHAFGSCPEGEQGCGRTQVNPVVPGLGGSGRQPGSAFKPFVLAAALREGVPRGWQERTRAGQEIDGCDDGGEPYEPENYSDDPGIKDMVEAIRVSNNVYHAKLAGLLGPDVLVASAEEAGLVSGSLPEQCSVALGSGSVFPLEMAAGYATFASGGEYCETLVVTRIELGDSAGGGEEEFASPCEQRFEPEIAANLTDMLQGVVASGTGTAAQLDRPVAGKTGTTDDYHDAWFVGYVPQMVTAAWVGFEQPEPMEDILGVARVTGGSIPAALWAEFMRPATESLEVIEFAQPTSQSDVEVPDFEDEDADDVLDDAEDDYTFNFETREVTDYRDAGTVADQRPDADDEVPAGTLITLGVSDGLGDPPRVPDVVGLEEGEARDVLTDADYEVTVEEEEREIAEDSDPPAAQGTVIRQRPDARTPLEPGEEVTIVVVRYERVPGEDDDAADDQEEEPGPGEPQEPSPDDDDDDEDGDGDDASPNPNEVSPFRGQVKFGRVVADPSGDDLARNGGEHVTLVSGRNPVDVSRWTITYEGGATLQVGEGYTMAAGAELDVHTGPGRNRPPRRYFNQLDREVLGDDGGVLILRDRQGREVARREY